MIILVESMQISAKIEQRHFPKRHRALRSWDQTLHVKDGEVGGVSHPGDGEEALPVEAGLGLEPSFLHSGVGAHVTSSQLILGLFICET